MLRWCRNIMRCFRIVERRVSVMTTTINRLTHGWYYLFEIYQLWIYAGAVSCNFTNHNKVEGSLLNCSVSIWRVKICGKDAAAELSTGGDRIICIDGQLCQRETSGWTDCWWLSVQTLAQYNQPPTAFSYIFAVSTSFYLRSTPKKSVKGSLFSHCAKNL